MEDGTFVVAYVYESGAGLALGVLARGPGLGRSGTPRPGGPGVVAVMPFILRLDLSVFNAVNGLAGRWVVTDWLARLGADDHILLIVLTLLSLSVVAGARGHRQRLTAFCCIICVVLSVVFSQALTFILNAVFFRPRPFTVHQVNLLFYYATDSSFPSSAAGVAFAQAFAVFFYRRRTGAVMLALALYLGFCRVMVGALSLDVLAGMTVGLAGALLRLRCRAPVPAVGGRLAAMQERLLASWRGGAA